MPIEFKLPELGENIKTADVIQVMVSPGAQIQKDQTVLELETNKAVFELPSTVSGVVQEVHVKKGDKIKVGQVVFTLEGVVDQTQQAPQPVEPNREERKAAPAPEAEKAPLPPIEKTAQTPPQKTSSVIAESPAPQKTSGAVYASPSVRRQARERGIDLNQIHPADPSGRISLQDLDRLTSAPDSSPPSHVIPTTPALPDFSKWGKIERKPMSNIREATAEAMRVSWSQIPHVTQFDEADITELEDLRKRFASRAEKAGGKLTLTAIILKVAATALKVFPQLNASLDLETKEIIYKNEVHIGVAVDTDRGLLVPVLRNVDEKNILEIARELQDLSQKARERKLGREQMEGASFTITNLGSIGGTHFTPIIPWPQVAILGVGRGKVQPVYVEGKLEARLILPLSLSYDHRLVDGADGARFLRWLADGVQQPFLMDLEG